MTKYIARRFGEMILTLFLIATSTFFLLGVIPGNALTGKIEKFPEKIQEQMLAKYGYDKPLLERYVITMKNMVFKGDFGQSVNRPGESLNTILRDKMPISTRLGVQQVAVGVTLGIILGIIAAMKRATAIDYIILVVAMILISMPSLVLSLLLQKYGAANSNFFNLPIIGWPSGKDLWFGGWEYTILPTIAGACGYIASYARLMKTSMLDVINQEYVLTARSKGLSEFKVVTRHILRNSFIPIITVLPMTIAGVISGSLFIERVFAIPGIGKYFVEAVQGRDIPMVMGQTIFFSAIYLVVIFVTDILYTVVDPRIKIVKG